MIEFVVALQFSPPQLSLPTKCSFNSNGASKGLEFALKPTELYRAWDDRRYGEIRIQLKPAGFCPTILGSLVRRVYHIFIPILMENLV